MHIMQFCITYRATPRAARASSLILLLLIALAGASFYAVRSAREAELRGVGGVNAQFPQPVRGAEQLLLGANAPLDTYDDATLDARLSLLASRNVRYVRQEFRWADIEKQKGQFDWAASDRIIRAAQKHNLQLLAVLLATPEWARPNSGSPQAPSPESTPPQDANDFAVFARAFVERYRDEVVKVGKGESVNPLSHFHTVAPSLILAYQIWDEPNLSSGWGDNLINPAAYLKLLLAGGDAIREANPTARIMLAGLAPTVEVNQVNMAPQVYLQRLYQLGAHDAFDIAAAKPYGYNYAAGDRRADPGLLNFSHVLLMRETMDAHGETQKAIWATEFGWNALPPGWQGEKSIWGDVTEAQQAEFTAHAIQRAAKEWHWMGAMFIDTLEPRPPLTATADLRDAAWGFALLDQQGQPRPLLDSFASAVAEATLAPRANLFALCDVSPRLVAKALDPNKMALGSRTEALNALPNLPAPCYWPNPLATFSEGWRFSELGADIPQRSDAKVTVKFSGDDFALIVRRAGREYRSYTFVTIDGKPANLLPQEPRGAYLIMNSADFAARVETIPIASNLGPGEHVAEITMDGGWNLWGLVGWSSRVAVSGFRFQVGQVLAALLVLVGLMGLAWATPRARWREALSGLAARPIFRPQAWHAALLGLLTWLTASLTWAQDAVTAYRNLGTPAPLVISALASAVAFWSPLYVLSLIALAALFVLVLLRLDLGLMLLAFFIPFYLQPQRLFAYSFSMVELLMMMCAASWLAGRLEIKRLEIRDLRLRLGAQSQISNLKSPISILQSLTLLDWGVMFLVLIALASSLQAQFKVEAFRELRVVIAESAALYFLLRTAKLSETQRWRILDGFIVGATCVALIGLFNYARGDYFVAEFGLPRIKSVFGSPNNDALYLGRAFPVLLAVAIAGKGMRDEGRGMKFHSSLIPHTSSLLYTLALLPITLALLLSQSRGALLLGMPAAVVVVCWLTGGRWRWVSLALGIGLVVGLAILFSGVAAPWVTGTRLENALDLQRGTGFFRINLWQSALRMIVDHPLLGVGPDNFLYAYRSFYILPAAWQEPNLSHPHNVFLDFASRLGVLGFVAGLAMFIGFARNLKGLMTRTDKPGFFKKPGLSVRPTEHRIIGIAFAGLLAEMLAHGLVDHSFFLVDLAFVFMLAAGISANLISTHNAENKNDPAGQ
jgi:O-antigen ligase